MPTALSIPPKSKRLIELEQQHQVALAVHNATLAQRDPSGVDAPTSGLIKEATRTATALRDVAGQTKELRREDGLDRGYQLEKTAAFQSVLTAKVVADAKALEATAALANLCDQAGADAVMLRQIVRPTLAETKLLQEFAYRTRAQGIDLKIIPTAVAEWIAAHPEVRS